MMSNTQLRKTTESGLPVATTGISLDTWLFSLFFSMILVAAAGAGLNRLHSEPAWPTISAGSSHAELEKKQTELAQAPLEERFAASSPRTLEQNDADIIREHLSKDMTASQAERTTVLSGAMPFDPMLFNDEIRQVIDQAAATELARFGQSIPSAPSTTAGMESAAANVTGSTTGSDKDPVTQRPAVLLAIADPEAVVVSNPELASIQSLPESGAVGLAVSGTYAARLAKIVVQSKVKSAMADSVAPASSLPVEAAELRAPSPFPTVSKGSVGQEEKENDHLAETPWAVASSSQFLNESVALPSQEDAAVETLTGVFSNVSQEKVALSGESPATATTDPVDLSAGQQGVVESLEPVTQVQTAASAKGNELWLVQAAPSVGTGCEKSFLFQLWNGCRWEQRASEDFLTDLRPTIVFVHGNWGDMSVAVRDGSALWHRMNQIIPSPDETAGCRIVIWKWNSEKVYHRIREDCQYKAQLADAYGPSLAAFLNQLGNCPVSLVGFSFGARMIGSALNCQEVEDGDSHYPVVLVCAATDYADFTKYGRYAKGMSRMASLLNIYNPTDKALRFYPLLYGHGGPSATGAYPLYTAYLTPQLATSATSVNTSCCGAEHSFVNAIACLPASYFPKYFIPAVFP